MSRLYIDTLLYLTSMQSISCEEKEIATHSTTLAWKIPWTEKPAGHGPWGRRELDTTEVTEYAHHAKCQAG